MVNAANYERKKITCNTHIPNVKYKKDGTPKATHSNSIIGKSSEVYGFTTKEEISAIMDVLNYRIHFTSDYKSANKIAKRNKLLFIIGMNTGLRASDIRLLKFSFFLDENKNGEIKFKEFYSLQPVKTKKTKKFVKLFFNEAVKKAIMEYISEYPIENLDEYLFLSRENNLITTAQIWNIVKDVAKEAGIKKNVGSHTFRKTWGYWCYNSAIDKKKALVTIQQCFNHSSSLVTLRYIGISDIDKSEMYNSICLGYECISVE